MSIPLLKKSKSDKIWIDPNLKLESARIPRKERIRWIVENSEKPVPEHKFKTLYDFVFEESFQLSHFGHFLSFVELIASTPGVYRERAKNGAVYLHSDASALSSDKLLPKYSPPSWALKVSSDPHKLPSFHLENQYVLNIYKEEKLLREYSLTSILFRDTKKGIALNVRGPQQSEGRSYVKIGRCPEADYILYHPTISRVHAIFQFAQNGGISLYDMSTHGTLLNNEYVVKQQYVPIKQGDTIQFGSSSRKYVFKVKHEKPPQLMPPLRDITRQSSLEAIEQKIEQLTIDLSCKLTNEQSEEKEQENIAPSEASRVFVINNINFATQVHQLNKLTVAKIKLYVQKNGLDFGRVKKSKLVKLVKADILEHLPQSKG